MSAKETREAAIIRAQAEKIKRLETALLELIENGSRSGRAAIIEAALGDA